MRNEHAVSYEVERAIVPGQVIDGRYRIDAPLGVGGMASVFRATHLALGHVVAIKVASPSVLAIPGMVARFLREARAATQWKSAHLTRVHDVGTLANGAPYMVMEYLEGRDLGGILAQKERLPVEEAVDYVMQACEALAEVHGLGIVHRDLKPSNLFVLRGADGGALVKVIDFGISRVDATIGEGRMTQPNVVMGSPRYMAPEQLQSTSSADARSDIWSLGALLYELVTGATPYAGRTALDLVAATLRPPLPASSRCADVPRDLDAVLRRCLSREPELRFTDVADLAIALAPFGGERSIERAENTARVHAAALDRPNVFLEEEAEADVAEADRSSIRRRVALDLDPPKKKRRLALAVAAATLAIAPIILTFLALDARDNERAESASVAASAATLTSAEIAPPPTATAEVTPTTTAEPTAVARAALPVPAPRPEPIPEPSPTTARNAEAPVPAVAEPEPSAPVTPPDRAADESN